MKLKSNAAHRLRLPDGRNFSAGSTVAVDDGIWAVWQHRDDIKAWLTGDHIEIVEEPKLGDDGMPTRKRQRQEQRDAEPVRDAAVEIEAHGGGIGAFPGPIAEPAARPATATDEGAAAGVPVTKRGRPRAAGKAKRKSGPRGVG